MSEQKEETPRDINSENKSKDWPNLAQIRVQRGWRGLLNLLWLWPPGFRASGLLTPLLFGFIAFIAPEFQMNTAL